MSNSARVSGWCSRVAALARRDDRGSQMVEFAVTLPLLMVFVVGIFDFSGAFTLKQKLTNAARDAARAAAAEPASDLGLRLPMSVNDAFLAMKNYLAMNQINDCGITASGSPTALTWTFTCPAKGGSTCIRATALSNWPISKAIWTCRVETGIRKSRA